MLHAVVLAHDELPFQVEGETVAAIVTQVSAWAEAEMIEHHIPIVFFEGDPIPGTSSVIVLDLASTGESTNVITVRDLPYLPQVAPGGGAAREGEDTDDTDDSSDASSTKPAAKSRRGRKASGLEFEAATNYPREPGTEPAPSDKVFSGY